MRVRIPNPNELALREFLGCEQTEMKRYSPTVYQWRGMYFEVLTVEQMRRGKVPASWYSNLGEFRMREMGKQAEKVKKIRRKNEKII
jgi:hypothetical protein